MENTTYKNFIINSLNNAKDIATKKKIAISKHICWCLSELKKMKLKKKDLGKLKLDILIENINKNISKFEPVNISNTFNGLSQLGYEKKDLKGLELTSLVDQINKNISNFKPIGISNTLNGLSQLGYTKNDLKGLELTSLVDQINKNISNFKPVEISNTLNGLSQLGYEKKDLKGLRLTSSTNQTNEKNTRKNSKEPELTSLVDQINKNISKFEPVNISNTFNGLSQLGYEKKDLKGLELTSLVDQINKNISNFKPIGISNTLNGLSQLGYTKNDLKGLQLTSIIEQINENISNFKPIGISNTLNGLSQLGYEKKDLKGLELTSLVDQINKNISNFKPIEISNTLNGLSQLGYEKKDLKGLRLTSSTNQTNEKNTRKNSKEPELTSLVDQINKNISNFKPVEISNTLNGLSQLGYEKKDLKGLELTSLVDQINKNISNFKPIGISNTLNGLSQLGYTKNDLKGLQLTSIVEQINENISKFELSGISNTLNGIITLFFYDGINKDNKIFINIIIKLIFNFKQKDLSQKMSFNKNLYFAKNILNLEKVKNINFVDFTEEEKEEMDKIRKNSQTKNEIKKANIFYNLLNGNKLEFQPSIENDGGFGYLMNKGCDIKIENNNSIYYIEIDGPSHFENNMKNYVPSSIIRNKIAIDMLSKSNNNKTIKYLTIPTNVIINKRGDLDKFIKYTKEPVKTQEKKTFLQFNQKLTIEAKNLSALQNIDKDIQNNKKDSEFYKQIVAANNNLSPYFGIKNQSK